MPDTPPEKRRFPDVFLWRLLMLLVLIVALSVSYPFYKKMTQAGFFPEMRIEISGFQPNELVAIEWSVSFTNSRREALADDAGVAHFRNVGPGNWRIIEGGRKELREAVFYFPDRHGTFIRKVGGFEIRMIYRRGGSERVRKFISAGKQFPYMP